jgi:uncharacterized membrane protein
MDVKKFAALNKALTVMLAVAVATLFSAGLYTPALAVMTMGILIAFSMRSKVKGVLTDERDVLVGGTAALIAVSTFCWIAIVVATSLHALSSRNPVFDPVATTLMISALALMALYASITHFPRIAKLSRKAWAAVYASIAVAAIVTVIALKLSSVGYWNCENGDWVKHNEPDIAKPTMPCPAR